MNSAMAGAAVSWHWGSVHSWPQGSRVPHAWVHPGHGPKWHLQVMAGCQRCASPSCSRDCVGAAYWKNVRLLGAPWHRRKILRCHHIGAMRSIDNTSLDSVNTVRTAHRDTLGRHLCAGSSGPWRQVGATGQSAEQGGGAARASQPHGRR